MKSILFLLLACADDPKTPSGVPSGDSGGADGADGGDSGPAPEAPDLTEVLVAGQSRAGQVVDPAALFAGISAEGDLGDYKIYNSRVRFIIEDVGDSSYYLDYGGGLIDADIVRPDGQPGRDMLDELSPMVGLGRILEAESVEVISDGSDGTAVVRVSGRGAPMRLLTGALESDSFVPDIPLAITVDYVLPADSDLLELRMSITNEGDDFAGPVGTLALIARDVADVWAPGFGIEPEASGRIPWIGLTGWRNEGALALIAGEEDFEYSLAASLVTEAAPGILGLSPNLEIPAGSTLELSTYVGVGRDLATLSGAQLPLRGLSEESLGGVVTAGGVPLAGARVSVLDTAGDPLTVAITDEAGQWSARVAEGSAGQLVAHGRGHGIHTDLPAGAAWTGPYDRSLEGALASLGGGATPIPFAEGYGASAPTDSGGIELVVPARLSLSVADGAPFGAQLCYAEGDAATVDARLVPGRPRGCAALAYSRDGQVELEVEPGSYSLTLFRSLRDEVWTSSLSLAAGETLAVEGELLRAFETPGVLIGDPHSHASPSGDGGISMEDRLIVTAAHGVELHFGTDHDHIADYRPLISPLGLEGHLQSVVAVEVSPVLRGHFNNWPIEPDSAAPNNGAPRWWQGYEDTAEIFSWMRALVGDGVIQANHPTGSSGLFGHADYDPEEGTVEQEDHWSADFDAMELLNDNQWSDYLPYYLDLLNRGARVLPVGVSDSHSHAAGHPGVNVTWMYTGTGLEDFSTAALKDMVSRKATVVGLGLYIDARIGGEWAPGGTFTGPQTLSAQVLAPTWVPVQQLSLYENGVAVDTVTCEGSAPLWCSAEWALSPTEDAIYVVMASSAAPMTAVWPGTLPWGATSGIALDTAGDGWDPPMPPLVVD